MGDGFDQVGKKNMMRENLQRMKRLEEEKKDKVQTEAKMDEFTHII